MNFDDTNPYADIINLPRHISVRHPQMSMDKRAAQFSPFAAMVGHDAAIQEIARLTEKQPELSEDEKIVIDSKLQWIQEHIKEQPEITVTYFQPDEKKNGGAYVTVTDYGKKIDEFESNLILRDGTCLPIEHILNIDSDLFNEL